MTITPEGARVLGSLVEKQLTTPQQYPLTANALSLACSQVTNRHPVVTMDEDAVLGALTDLKQERLVRFVLPSHGRSVTRYRHVLDEVYALDEPSLALLAVLFLRGPQTPGELRTRTERMAAFSTVADVQDRLEDLVAREAPLVRLLPRRPGQKEERWQQTLAEQWEGSVDPPGDRGSDPVGGGTSDPAADRRGEENAPPASGRDGEVAALRRDLESLTVEVADLRGSLTELAGSLDALRLSLGG